LGHDLLDVPLLLVVILVGVVVSFGVVVLLSHGTVDDEVGGVAALEAALRVSSPLLLKLMHRPKFHCMQANLVVRNALLLLIGSCSKRR
jgi:hypothetical protein